MVATTPNIFSVARNPTRIAAVVEVALSFVAVHVAFRFIKQFTSWGHAEGAAHVNFIPGAVMIMFTMGLIIIRRRSFSSYGLSWVNVGENVTVGLICGGLLAAGAGLLMLVGVHHPPGVRPPTMMEGVAYGLAGLGAALVFAWLIKLLCRCLKIISGYAGALGLFAVFCLPLVVAYHHDRSVIHTLLTVSWLVIGAGVGEEFFYRGYIQSRINETFGRPFQIGSVQFGAGLLISSLLFGFFHALNTVDYFNHRYTFAWGFGVANVGVGLFYGCLRESTGSVMAGIVTHAVLDVIVIIPGLFSNP